MTRLRERHERDLRRYDDDDGAGLDREHRDDVYRELRRDVLATQRRRLDGSSGRVLEAPVPGHGRQSSDPVAPAL